MQGIELRVTTLWYNEKNYLNYVMEDGLVDFMVFNATFNNISIILWRSVFLVEEFLSARRKPPTYRKSLI